MKKILLTVLLGVLCVVPVSLTGDIELGSRGRPYSFYYPYNYQYYTPHVQRSATSAMACHWVYTNGIYVYKCD